MQLSLLAICVTPLIRKSVVDIKLEQNYQIIKPGLLKSTNTFIFMENGNHLHQWMWMTMRDRLGLIILISSYHTRSMNTIMAIDYMTDEQRLLVRR